MASVPFHKKSYVVSLLIAGYIFCPEHSQDNRGERGDEVLVAASASPDPIGPRPTAKLPDPD